MASDDTASARPVNPSERIDAIDVLCSIEGIELLAATNRHTRARTRRTLVRAVTAILDTTAERNS